MLDTAAAMSPAIKSLTAEVFYLCIFRNYAHYRPDGSLFHDSAPGATKQCSSVGLTACCHCLLEDALPYRLQV